MNKASCNMIGDSTDDIDAVMSGFRVIKDFMVQGGDFVNVSISC